MDERDEMDARGVGAFSRNSIIPSTEVDGVDTASRLTSNVSH